MRGLRVGFGARRCADPTPRRGDPPPRPVLRPAGALGLALGPAELKVQSPRERLPEVCDPAYGGRWSLRYHP